MSFAEIRHVNAVTNVPCKLIQRITKWNVTLQQLMCFFRTCILNILGSKKRFRDVEIQNP
jgi:hypothetical protein